eukprot:305781_1
MGNTASEKKLEKQKNNSIKQRLDEAERKSEKIVTVLIMGKGTLNFLNALQCIRDDGIDKELRLGCKPYIYNEMIVDLKFLIQKSVESNDKVWSSNLYKHCVTDSLLIYGFIKTFMEYNPIQKKYSISQRDVVWDTDIKALNNAYTPKLRLSPNTNSNTVLLKNQ